MEHSAHIYYAQKSSEAHYYHANPNLWWVSLFGGPDPIVRVSIREWGDSDPPSDYWGWVELGETPCDYYLYVFPSEVQLETCFHYGTKAEESMGRGRKVHLVVTELT